MPTKKKTVEEHLEAIEYLLASIVLERKLDVKIVAKVLGCSDNKLTAVLSKRGKKNA